MVSQDRLLQLFQAFHERNDAGFRRAAESIISDELAANHHSLARELKKALGVTPSNASTQSNSFRSLGRSQQLPGDLLYFPKSLPDDSRVVLGEDATRHINRVLDEHRNRLKLAQHGYRPKSRLLFWGPPGCGKTLSAHHLALSLGLPLGILRLSAVVSSYLGETSSRLQQVFDVASQSPMVLFLDEVDAVAKDRDDDNDVGELKRIVNTLLQAMDNFSDNHSVLIAASNHQHLLDTAVWRRFDTVVQFPLPGPAEREAFLKKLLNGVTLTGSIGSVVKATDTLSFADVERAVTEAVKSMILSDRSDLRAGEITEEVKSIKATIKQARQRAPRTPRES